MSFDPLARHYRWIECISAGDLLQRCRTALLSEIPPPKTILNLGEGNGRFLAECHKRFPSADVLCLDSSAKMLSLARQRLQRSDSNTERIQFTCADVLDWSAPKEKFDLIVTHFVLDCFPPEQLEKVVAKLADATAANAQWLLSDFRTAGSGLRGVRSRLILWMLYRFFRSTTGLPASRLTAPDGALERSGFVLQKRRTLDWDLLHSDLWQRTN